MESQRILHVTSELTPYFPENTQSNRVLDLAKALYKKGNDVRIFLPKYGTINERRYQLHEVIRLSGMNLIINDLDQPLVIKVASLPSERMQAYFIDNEEYFKRKSYYGNEETPWFNDNGERMIFFVKGVLETIKKLNWVPDIIHVHGWMAAMIPIYLKTFYANDTFFKDTKIINSLYNSNIEKSVENSLQEILKFDGINWIKDNEILTIISESANYSDLLIKGEEDLEQELESIITKSGKTVLEFNSLEEFLPEYFSHIESKETIES